MRRAARSRSEESLGKKGGGRAPERVVLNISERVGGVLRLWEGVSADIEDDREVDEDGSDGDADDAEADDDWLLVVESVVEVGITLISSPILRSRV